jgi:5-methylcytosine-specific restriction enzyme A
MSKFKNPRLNLKGPNGYYLCRTCGTEVQPPKKTFCCWECVRTWLWEHRPKVRRKAVLARDKGVCACCGLNTKTISLRHARAVWGLPRDRRSVWDVDHIKTLAEGGNHDLSNLQTLCYKCHQQKTTQVDMPRIRARRRHAGS